MAKKEGKSVQKKTENKVLFKPTNKMLEWFQTALELGYTASISSVAEKCKQSRNNWYVWVQNSEFVLWFDSEMRKHLTISRWKLDAIGMKKAEENYDYWLSMMERVGNLLPDSSTLPSGRLTIREIIAEKWNKYGNVENS